MELLRPDRTLFRVEARLREEAEMLTLVAVAVVVVVFLQHLEAHLKQK